MPCKCSQPQRKRHKPTVHSRDVKSRTPEEADKEEDSVIIKRRPCLKGFANVEIEHLIMRGILK